MTVRHQTLRRFGSWVQSASISRQRSWRRSRTCWTVVRDLAYMLHSLRLGRSGPAPRTGQVVKCMGASIGEAALRLEGEIMADRPQGTTQEPGRTPAADRPSDGREQGREQGGE